MADPGEYDANSYIRGNETQRGSQGGPTWRTGVPGLWHWQWGKPVLQPKVGAQELTDGLNFPFRSSSFSAKISTNRYWSGLPMSVQFQKSSKVNDMKSKSFQCSFAWFSWLRLWVRSTSSLPPREMECVSSCPFLAFETFNFEIIFNALNHWEDSVKYLHWTIL